MSQKVLSGAFAVLVVSGAAFAQSVSPGDVQLAASAGVEPGVYTTAQMIQVIEARREGDEAQVAFVLSKPSPVITRADFTAAIPSAVFNDLTVAEEVQLQEARRENDHAREIFILTHSNRRAPLPASAVTPGEAQLAAIVGVDAAEYTLAELIAMQPATTDF